jgi:membrane protease subunit HflK
MSWDWEKLKQQQGRGGVPPQMDDIVDRFKKAKIPAGGPVIVAIIVIALIALTSVYTVAPSEVGVVQFFGRYERT